MTRAIARANPGFTAAFAFFIFYRQHLPYGCIYCIGIITFIYILIGSFLTQKNIKNISLSSALNGVGK